MKTEQEVRRFKDLWHLAIEIIERREQIIQDQIDKNGYAMMTPGLERAEDDIVLLSQIIDALETGKDLRTIDYAVSNYQYRELRFISDSPMKKLTLDQTYILIKNALSNKSQLTRQKVSLKLVDSK